MPTDKERITALETWKTDIVPLLREIRKDVKHFRKILYLATGVLIAIQVFEVDIQKVLANLL